MNPWMTKEEILLIEKVLKKIDPIRSLEWGAGGSTEHFPQCVTGSWLTIEHDKQFVPSDLPDNVEVKIEDLLTNNYITSPTGLFDFILVDGRKRNNCLERAKQLLSDNGVVILHDAERPRYHQALIPYKYQKYLSERLWIGSNKVDVNKLIQIQLDIILRTCDKELRPGIHRIAPKKEIIQRCTTSLFNSIIDYNVVDTQLHIVDDHSDEPIKHKNFHALEKTGNAESLKYCYELALEVGRELIYFVEDDWLHFPEAISEMVGDWQTFQSKSQLPCAIHPYDDPDRYERDGSRLQSYIVRGKSRHYRTNQFSTQTFMIHKDVFFQHWTTFMDNIEQGVQDHITNKIWQNGVVLFSPLRSLAIHMNGGNPEIFQDWRKLWEK